MASRIQPDSYGLVFGVNTFMALFFQTILTLVVADDAGLALPPRIQVGSIISEDVTFYDNSSHIESVKILFQLFSFQFIVYGGFWIAISLLFLSLFVGSNF